MRGHCKRNRNGFWWGAAAAVPILLVLALPLVTACGRQATASGEPLPGRSRPVLQHDWPHPRNIKFGPITFAPPPAGAALVTTGVGLRAFVLSDDAAPLVRITAALPLGRLYERDGEAGAAAVLTQILTSDLGTATPPLSQRLEELGTRIDIEDDLDLTRLTMDVLPEDWRAGVTLMVDVLRRPDIDPVFISSYRAGSGYVMVTSGVAGHGFRPKVELERLVAGYPLAPVDPGTQVRPEAVRALASRTLRHDAIALGIGGNAPRREAEALLQKLTAGWAAQTDQKAGPLAATIPVGHQAAIQMIDDVSLQGWIAIGRPIGPVPDEERPALAALTEILNIRLNIAAREIRGLANKTTFESPRTANGAGLLLVRSGGRIESVAPLVKYSLDEVRRIASREDAVSQDEMEQAKGILALGEWQGALEGAVVAAGTYAAETVRYGSTERLLKWPEAVQAVTAEQVKAVATKYLQPDEIVTVVIGPVEKIRKARHPRWPVSLDELTGPTRTAGAGLP